MRVIAAVGRTLVVLGLLLLGFAAFQLWGTGVEESTHQDELSSQLSKQLGTTANVHSVDALAKAVETPRTADPAAMVAVPEGEAVGAIVIPKIGVEKFFVQGTDKADLKKGPGHYTGTPYPGQPGNAAIAGHRTTYGAPFNRLDELVPGDQIDAYTAQGHFRYEVLAPASQGVSNGPGWFTVRPDQTAVLDAPTDGGAYLTLTACHPKYSAKERIIVRAKLVGNAPAPAAPVDSTQPVKTPEQVADHFEASLGWQPQHAPRALLLSAALGLIWLLGWFAGRRWKRWPAYALTTPVFLITLWFAYTAIDRWLPSI
jgi:sortase A